MKEMIDLEEHDLLNTPLIKARLEALKREIRSLKLGTTEGINHRPTYKQVFMALLIGGVTVLKFNGQGWEVASKSPCIHINRIDDVAEGWRLVE